MDDDRTRQLQRLGERREELLDVVARHESDVRDPEVLEQPARLGEVHDRVAESLAELAERRADDGDAADHRVVLALARLPGAAQLDRAEIRRERPDRRADRHLVIVEDDQQLGLPLADVIERFEAQAARDRRVADHDRDPLHPVAQVAGGREALADRQARPGVAAVEHVVLRLASPREAADAADLAERPESVVTAGQQLVGVGLMAGGPHDPVSRRFEEPMEGDGQLDDAERATEMATGRRDRRDDRLADLGGELLELGFGQAAQIGGPVEGREDGHAGWLLDDRAESSATRRPGSAPGHDVNYVIPRVSMLWQSVRPM
jgi:hypothetical protein